MSEKYEKEYLDDLTDEERAALEDGDDVEIEDDGDEGEGEDAAPEPNDKGADDTGEEPGQSGDDEFEPEGPTPVPVPLDAEVPEDAEAILSQLDEKEAEVEQQFEDGDLTAAEYRKELRAIASRRDEINRAMFKADIAREMLEKAELDAWKRDVADFMSTTGAYIDRSELLKVAFDRKVREVTGDPANANLSNRQQLLKAHKAFVAELEAAGIHVGVKAQAKEQPRQKASRPVPPSLARVPSADIETTDDGRFAAIDRLADTDPEAYEAALLKLEQRGELEDYLSSR